MFGYAGWYGEQPFRDILFYVPFQQLFLFPPVLYFYIKTQLDKSFRFAGTDLLHFAPFLVYLIYTLIVFVMDKLILQEYYFYADGRDKDFSPWYQFSGFVSMLVYTIVSLRLYNRYKNLTFQTVSFADSILYRWIKRFLLALLLILIVRVLFFIINPEWDKFGSKFWYYLCFSVLFYYISINGYVYSIQSVIPFKADFIFENLSVLSSIDDNITNAGMQTAEQKAELETWKLKVEQLMTVNKAFENPMLALTDVAGQLGTNVKKVSQVINQGFEMNFNDYVNYHRTLEVIKKLKSGKQHSHNLLGIAYDCGFNSKSTFNRAFKKHTSLTPKEYLDKL